MQNSWMKVYYYDCKSTKILRFIKENTVIFWGFYPFF